MGHGICYYANCCQFPEAIATDVCMEVFGIPDPATDSWDDNKDIAWENYISKCSAGEWSCIQCVHGLIFELCDIPGTRTEHSGAYVYHMAFGQASASGPQQPIGGSRNIRFVTRAFARVFTSLPPNTRPDKYWGKTTIRVPSIKLDISSEFNGVEELSGNYASTIKKRVNQNSVVEVVECSEDSYGGPGNTKINVGYVKIQGFSGVDCLEIVDRCLNGPTVEASLPNNFTESTFLEIPLESLPATPPEAGSYGLFVAANVECMDDIRGDLGGQPNLEAGWAPHIERRIVIPVQGRPGYLFASVISLI